MRKAIAFTAVSVLIVVSILASGCAAPESLTGPDYISTTVTNSSTTSVDVSNSILSFIVATPIPPASDPTPAYRPPALKNIPSFTTVNETLSFGESQYGIILPSGSIIYHWKNKITEVIGPDDSIIFICRDTEVAQIPTPGGGPQPVTRVLGVPNGGMISEDPENENIIRVFDGKNLIGTIVTKSEDFPYAPTQILNSSQQYFAEGRFADGSSGNITSQVTWNTSNPAVASVSPDGVVTALSEGTANITASFQGITSLPVQLTVNSLVSITASSWSGIGAPRTLTSLPVGATWKVFASGTYSDGFENDLTDDVVWTSSNPQVAAIDQTGTITGISAGGVTVTASLYGITSPPISFSVVSLSAIEVSVPEQLTIGEKIWCSCSGIYSDGSTQGIVSEVTWSSSYPSVAVISADGLLTAIAEGTTKITASANGIVSEPVTFTVVAN